MQVIMETDEAWALMTLITSYVIDNSGLSQDGKQKARRWRTDHADGTVEMDELAVELNNALGAYLDERTTRLIRKKGRYMSTKETAR